MSWEEEFDDYFITDDENSIWMNFDSSIEDDILFSEGAPLYEVRNYPIPDFGLVWRNRPPPFDQIIFSINFIVQCASSTSSRMVHAASVIDTTIQVTARILLHSNGEAIAPFPSTVGVLPDMHRPILDQICKAAQAMLAEPHNALRLIYSVRTVILNGMPIAVHQGVSPFEVEHGLEEIMHMVDGDQLGGDAEEGNHFDGNPATESSIRALKRVSYARDCEGTSSDCSICLEAFKPGMELTEMPCSHIFHGGCIEKWLKQSHTCPLCRYRMPCATG
ncbi:uncharacterized protein LOC116193665 [Punica granatum]|uniref:RING-type E3 ubiquitin transferase n=1 Tax=Punica granatum TaxID=22663 RepID=A0A6P8C702_PUNGR|nr:uncharacterized protein LOC116193665 [Punica granatum]